MLSIDELIKQLAQQDLKIFEEQWIIVILFYIPFFIGKWTLPLFCLWCICINVIDFIIGVYKGLRK